MFVTRYCCSHITLMLFFLIFSASLAHSYSPSSPQFPFTMSSNSSASICSSNAFPYPALFGAEFLYLEANLVQNFSKRIFAAYYPNHGSVDLVDVSFCNVSISYTHPRQNDEIHVQVYLPIDWNGRFQMVGGGGWQAGLFSSSIYAMLGAVGEGYSTISTDAGLPNELLPDNWALLSPGNANLYNLQNLASTSLNDAAIIGKAISNSFYGEAPKYSYFTGCSQGGRQGLMLAQRYPDAFDGIASSAPAINWSKLFTALTWPSWFMNDLGYFPPACEIRSITDAVMGACDGLDGLIDGIIGFPDKCAFDPISVVGKSFFCSEFNTTMEISDGAAAIVAAYYLGPSNPNNTTLSFGFNHGALLAGSTTEGTIIPTTCTSTNGIVKCTPIELSFATDWIRYFILKDADADVYSLTLTEFQETLHKAIQQYGSMIDTNDPDLSTFKARGGKMLGFHGMADHLIPINNTLHYYDSVTALDPNVSDFYRIFTAPGIHHCWGGPGPYPDGTFDSLVKWVEDGEAPEVLNATSTDYIEGEEGLFSRPLCLYPKFQKFDGEGFICE